MAVQHNGNSSVFDLMPSTYVRPDPEIVAKTAARESVKRSSDELAGFGGRTPNEIQVLKVLRADGPVGNAGEIVTKTGLRNTDVSVAISDLVARGLVRRREDDGFTGARSRIEAV